VVVVRLGTGKVDAVPCGLAAEVFKPPLEHGRRDARRQGHRVRSEP
jgi:hypothetical protein